MQPKSAAYPDLENLEIFMWGTEWYRPMAVGGRVNNMLDAVILKGREQKQSMSDDGIMHEIARDYLK